MSHRTATQLHIPALVLVLQEQEGVRSPLDLLSGLVAISTLFQNFIALKRSRTLMSMFLSISMPPISSETPHCPCQQSTEYASDYGEDPDYEVYFRVY
jgi:hypothetical protein